MSRTDPGVLGRARVSGERGGVEREDRFERTVSASEKNRQKFINAELLFKH